MLGNLNHVAIAVPDLEAAIYQYKDVFQAFVSTPEDLPLHGVRIAIVKLSNTTIELITPLDENSTIQGFLNKNPSGGIHHLCYEVTDIAKARDHLTNAGLQVIGDGTPKEGYHGNPVLFFNPKDCLGTLIELEEVAIAQTEGRIETQRIGPAHTFPQNIKNKDTLLGYGSIGIEVEVDFKAGTPKDNDEDE